MNFYKITLQYNGHGFQGWQIQKDDNGITIQGALNKALKKVSKSDSVRSIGCGRTDTGVHALKQVVRVEIPLEIQPEALKNALNSHLPSSIKVVESSLTDDQFHPVFGAKEKEYHYLFKLEDENPFMKDLITYKRSKELDFDKMKKCCELFIGEHDFSDYQCVGTEVKTTVREIFDCKLELVESGNWPASMENDYWVLKIKGTGFLKQMVRLIVGTLWAVGQGRASLEEVEQSLSRPSGKKLGAVAPPNGLYLVDVTY